MMGPGEAISILAACLVVIAGLALTFAVYSKRLAFKQRKMELDAQRAQTGRGSDEVVDRLEKRVRVLERLATDRGQDVAVQIEALRDARRTEALADASDSEVRS